MSGKGDGTHVSKAMYAQVPCDRRKLALVETAKERLGSAPGVLCSGRISFSPFQPANALSLSPLLI